MSSSKRHFTVVIRNKEHGLYVSSTPSSAARKAVSKLCADNKKKKVEFSIRETTQASNKKIYGPYIGYMQKLDKPVELKGRVIRYKPIAKLKKKSRKMKGGVEILGEGFEGIVLRPNINNLESENKVSKLIKATPEEIEKLIAFEQALNRIDEDGRYHVKMLNTREIKSENINAIPNINQTRKNGMKEKEYNFKITYQFGGISIEIFLGFLEEKNKVYVDLIKPNFIQSLLIGIVNCFQGLYEFYYKGIAHSDLHAGNIVFLLENPKIMRIIDWGIFLSDIANLSRNSRNVSNKLIERMEQSLFDFTASIRDLFNQIKRFTTEENKQILTEFLELLNSVKRNILNQDELNEVRLAMEGIIANIK
jgi:hypothetical protein